MKKIKYRNNNNNYNNQVYSINYKFDSISPAGKCCGTALDLIKKYNELAKEAHSNGDYVEAEVFRQYAEHYRKIITEINERKNVRFGNKENENGKTAEEVKEVSEPLPDNQENASASAAEEQKQDALQENSLIETKPKAQKKSFTVIEVADDKPQTRKYRTKKTTDELSVNQ